MPISLKKPWGDYICPTDNFYMLRPAGMGGSPKRYKHRLLVVYDRPFHNDTEVGELHSYKAGTTMLANTPEWRKPTMPSETIDRLLHVAGYEKWDKVAVGWQFHDLEDLTDDLVERAFQAFDKRLTYYIKKLEPTAILFMGDAPLVNYAKRKGKRVPVGRVFKYKGVDAIWTVPAAPLCVPDPGTSSLLGQAMDHADAVRVGKNRYTARKLEQPTEIVYCDTLDKVEEAVEACLASPQFAYDTEGANLNRIINTLLSVQLAPTTDKAYFIPCAHVDSPFGGKTLDQVYAKLRRLFHTYTGTVITAHGKYDLIMARVQLKVPHMRFKLYDVAAAEYAIDENRKYYSAIISAQKVYLSVDGERKAEKDRDKHNKNKLSAWGLQRIEEDYGISRGEDILGKDQRTNMSAVPLEQIVPYGILDVVNLLLIKEQQERLAKRRGFPNFQGYVEHLGLMTHVFASMEVRGLPTDVPALIALRKADGPVRKAIREAKAILMESDAAKHANAMLLRQIGAPAKSLWGNQTAWVFNPDKDESQQTLFFGVLHLKGFGITATGKKSVGKQFLKNNAAHPIVAAYADYVEAKKFKTGFVDSFAAIISTNPDARATQRIRSSYGFLTVLTGRTSSTDPNLQNLPAHGKLAKLIKKITKAVFGYGLIKQDFGQNEIRGYAIISKDSAYAAKFWNSILMHKAYRVATDPAKIDELHKEWDTKGDTHVQAVWDFFKQRVNKKHALRQAVKAVIFGVLYGKSARSLALELALVEIKQLREELKALRAANDNQDNERKRAA
jgi:DNA polymerase I-like protein with 3'-5' exonuclease and polymerase domains